MASLICSVEERNPTFSRYQVRSLLSLILSRMALRKYIALALTG
ncbi:MAG: hypothetical protein V7K27_16380 [Nostoc sp.]